MKIDVELMEMEVLKGAKKFIKKNKPFLWIENHWNFPNQINNALVFPGIFKGLLEGRKKKCTMEMKLSALYNIRVYK